jgi:hypothetical protein
MHDGHQRISYHSDSDIDKYEHLTMLTSLNRTVRTVTAKKHL